MSTPRALAPVMEVFASIQGEGAHVGEPQVLLRLRGCPLRCRWCDTPGSWALGTRDRARIAAAAGERRRDPWTTPYQAACWVAEVEPGEPRTVSVTGGEPLLWPGFLLGLPPVLGPRRLHLETAGAHPETLARVLPAVDHVSLDLKLPADLDPPVPPDPELATRVGAVPSREPSPADPAAWRAARRASLKLVAGGDAAAKLVVAGERRAADYAPLLEDLARIAPDLPLFLQPVTPMGGVPAPGAELLAALVEDALDLGLAVRVVPQVHRALRVP